VIWMPVLTADTIARVDAYWMVDLGCPRAQLRSPQAVVLPHADEFYAGIFILLIGEAPIISLPHHLYLALRATAASWSAADVLHGTCLRTSRDLTKLSTCMGPTTQQPCE
jgi:hypothetical protein